MPIHITHMNRLSAWKGSDYMMQRRRIVNPIVQMHVLMEPIPEYTRRIYDTIIHILLPVESYRLLNY